MMDGTSGFTKKRHEKINLFFTNLHMLDYFVNFAESWFSNVKRNEETKFCSESFIRQRV